jgi:hypothetical protein
MGMRSAMPSASALRTVSSAAARSVTAWTLARSGAGVVLPDLRVLCCRGLGCVVGSERILEHVARLDRVDIPGREGRVPQERTMWS